jgi:hypothetical protein
MNEIQLQIADFLLTDSYDRRPLISTIPSADYIGQRIEPKREVNFADVNLVRDIFLKENIIVESFLEGERNIARGFSIDLKGIEIQQEYGSYSAYYKKEKKKVKRAEKRETREYRIKVLGFWITSIGLAISLGFNIYQALK